MFEYDFLIKMIMVLIFVIAFTVGNKKLSPAFKHQFGSFVLLLFIFLPFFDLSLFKFEIPLVSDIILDQHIIAKQELSENIIFPREVIQDSELNSNLLSRQNYDNIRGNNLDILSIIWYSGIAFLGLRLIAGYWITIALIRKSSEIGNNNLIAQVTNLKKTLRIKRNVKVYSNDRIKIPFVFGLTVPIVFLPLDYHNWETDKLNAVLIHELAHIKRFDFFWSLVGNVAAIVHWFNPLVWILKKSIYVQREKSCDKIVLSSGINSVKYAETLLDFTRIQNQDKLSSSVLAITGKKFLESRIKAIISGTKCSDSIFVGKILPIIIVAGIITVSFSITPTIKAQIESNDLQIEVTETEYRDIESAMNNFYSDIQSGEFIRAIEYFANTSDFNDNLKMPLGITNTITEGPMYLNRSLTAEHWSDILIMSKIKEIKKENGIFKITEEFYLEASHEELEEDIQILNENREVRMIKDQGIYKFINDNPVKSILLWPKKKTLTKVGISISPDGLRCVHYIVRQGTDPYIKNFN